MDSIVLTSAETSGHAGSTSGPVVDTTSLLSASAKRGKCVADTNTLLSDDAELDPSATHKQILRNPCR